MVDLIIILYNYHIYYKQNIHFKCGCHALFDIDIIWNYFNKYKNDKIIKDKGHFFDKIYVSYLQEIFKQDYKIYKDLIKQSFKIKDFTKLDEMIL